MDEKILRNKLIRLAHKDRDIRQHLLPLLKEAKIKTAVDKDIPDKVKEIAKNVEEKGNDPGMAYAIAWSVYCRYKEPGSPHCHKSPNEYFPGRP